MTTGTVSDSHPIAPAPRSARAPSGAALTWVIAAVFGALVAIALVVALAAALVVGSVVAVAALVLRLSPRRHSRDAPATLEGRRTPDGWVVEAALRR